MHLPLRPEVHGGIHSILLLALESPGRMRPWWLTWRRGITELHGVQSWLWKWQLRSCACCIRLGNPVSNPSSFKVNWFFKKMKKLSRVLMYKFCIIVTNKFEISFISLVMFRHYKTTCLFVMVCLKVAHRDIWIQGVWLTVFSLRAVNINCDSEQQLNLGFRFRARAYHNLLWHLNWGNVSLIKALISGYWIAAVDQKETLLCSLLSTLDHFPVWPLQRY